MADNAIAQLSIDVVANLKINKSQTAKMAEEAKKEMEKITSKSLFSGLSNVNNSFKQLTDSIKSSNAFKQLSTRLTDVTKRFNGFFSAIKRIAVYRAIRWALKEIIQAFQEGIQNAYQWSVVTGNRFAKSMDTMSTAALYLKNSLGAMTMPLVNMLAPIIDRITDRFVNLINVINRFVATLSGATSWTKALKYPAKYLEQAAGAAKELKNQLLGFDELNVLNAPSGGGGGASQDYSSMFENVDLKKFSALGKLLVGAGLVQAGVGAVLLFTGHPWLGVALLASGLNTIVKGVTNEITDGGLSNEIKRRFEIITGIVGGASLALGAILLAAPATLPLGIALMAAGAAGVVSAVAMNWNGIVNFLKDGWQQIKSVCKTSLQGTQNAIFEGLSNIKSKISTFIEAIKTTVKSLFDWGVSGLSSFISNFSNAVLNAIQKVKNWLNDVFGRSYSLQVSTYVGEHTSAGGNTHSGGGGRTFAQGGYPSAGTMFIAGEAGPEFVGNIGGRTGVMNTDQMAQALASANAGVVEAVTAMANAVVQAINRKDTSINVNDVRIALKNSNLRYGV